MLVLYNIKFIKEDLIEAGKYLNRENLIKLSRKSEIWKKVLEDVLNIEEILNISLGPKTEDDKKHKSLTGRILTCLESSTNPTTLIVEAAILRHSLG